VEAIKNIRLDSLLDTLVSLGTAFILGALIGLERQVRQRTAGLRTNVLVAVGAAVFVDAANRLNGHEGAVRALSYVVSGVGFLGAGVIMREHGSVRGLNTAATLWGSAASGACAGADLILEAVLGATFVLAANTLLRPVVHRIERQPIEGAAVELTYSVKAVVERSEQKKTMNLIEQMLAGSHLPIRDIDVHAFGEDEVAIEATLAATSVDRQDLNHLVERLNAVPAIRQVFWRPNSANPE